MYTMRRMSKVHAPEDPEGQGAPETEAPTAEVSVTWLAELDAEINAYLVATARETADFMDAFAGDEAAMERLPSPSRGNWAESASTLWQAGLEKWGRDWSIREYDLRTAKVDAIMGWDCPTCGDKLEACDCEDAPNYDTPEYWHAQGKKLANQCMGCQAGWPLETRGAHSSIHLVVGGYAGEICSCTKDKYQ